ncbi:MAG: UbiA-like polyprenyltransferase [Chitinophagaceae bacterium]
MATIKNYLSLIKFSHTIFALPFAFIGFFLGLFHKLLGEIPFEGPLYDDELETDILEQIINFSYLHLFLLVIGCMISARSAAMAFNRYLDRHFDAKNPRTAIREIPKGIIKPSNALFFTILSSFIFIYFTYHINRLCFYLSPVALLVILGYSYTKRFTPLCHLILGLGLSLAPIGAYLAVTGSFNMLPILFSLSVLFWVSGFDIIYALQDEEFDKENNLFSIPSWVGKEKALMFSKFLHLLSAISIVGAGWYGGFGIWYGVGVLVFISMLLYQHSIVKPNDLSKVNLAFMTANGIASVIFSIFVILDLFL